PVAEDAPERIVPTGHDQRAPTGDQAGPGHDAASDGAVENEREVGDRADVAYGGDAALEGVFGVPGHPKECEFLTLAAVDIRGVRAAVPAEVDVQVDQARHAGPPLEIDARVGERRSTATHLGDAVTVHEEPGAGYLRRASAVDERQIRQKGPHL